MSENPTLRRGDEGVDGWVEYLQTLLRVHGYSGHQPEDGIFDEITEQWVTSYQRYHQPPLKDDGIVGDQTWSALRDEPELQPVGSDGRDPHTYTEHGVELRFTTEMDYMPYDDMVWCRASSVGDVDPPSGSINAYVMIKHPDGSSAEMRAEHENGENEGLHAFRIYAVTGAGPAGRYSMIMQLPMETGGDTLQFEFDRPAL